MSESDPEKQLYDILNILRNQGFDPSSYYNNRALEEFAEKKPLTRDGLLSIDPDEEKFQRFGKSFLAVINKHKGMSAGVPKSPEEAIRALLKKGENQQIEFKSTLRMNLRTEKKDNEIKKAWLKGVVAFLNTDGGTLLLGVNDEGVILGNEHDAFKNNDQYQLCFNDLIKTYIGPEFSDYIRLELVCVEGKTLGKVVCSRSKTPVYFKDGDAEAFYIRRGPSSFKLNTRETICYIESRSGGEDGNSK